MCKNSDEPAPASIDDLSEDRFVQGWTAIVGEPPSIMLDRYREMIVVLVNTVPADPEDASAFGRACAATSGRFRTFRTASSRPAGQDEGSVVNRPA